MLDGTEDDEYLETLAEALSRITQHEPDLIFYLGGADPFRGDNLGRLGLTKKGLKARDRMVMAFARSEHVPVVTLMSGGYAKNIGDTVDIHCNTIRAVKEVYFTVTDSLKRAAF